MASLPAGEACLSNSTSTRSASGWVSSARVRTFTAYPEEFRVGSALVGTLALDWYLHRLSLQRMQVEELKLIVTPRTSLVLWSLFCFTWLRAWGSTNGAILEPILHLPDVSAGGTNLRSLGRGKT
jgi:hypothetical protein